MEPEKFFSDRTNQTLLQQAELAAILRMLSISEGTFSLSIAICNSPALREYLISKITEQKAGIEKIPIEKDCTDVLAFAEKKITIERPSAIFITEIENALPSDEAHPRIIRNLNASRELWQQKFSCPVIFWMAEYGATILQRDALDFASWLSHTFEFVSEQATAATGMLDAYAGDIMSAGRLDADQKRFRIAELEQRIKDAGDPPKPELSQHVLTWLHELIYICRAIGDLDAAEENALKSLRIAKKFSQQAEIATAYSNLGLVYRTRTELDKAEQMLTKALEIEEKYACLEGMACSYGNLGGIHLTRGDLDKAEQMLKKSLEIDEKLSRLEGMASDYGNLGLIYQKRGDLDMAEQMHNKSLEINKKLGWLDGTASEYGNLGVIYQKRGDMDKAELMHNKSLEINKRLGRLDGMAIQYGNLGVIYQTRGDLDKAEQISTKALEINEKLGRLEGMANQYGNIGTVYQKRGDFDKARESWGKALELFRKIGMKNMIEKVQKGLEELNEGRES